MDLFLTLIKWPLIIVSVLGVTWIIWWLFWDTSNDSPTDDLADATGFDLRILLSTGMRTPELGLWLLMISLAGFAIAIYYQLSPSLQQKILSGIESTYNLKEEK